MDDANYGKQGFEIMDRVFATVKDGAKCIVFQATCKETNEIVWITGDDQVCAVTRMDFLRGKMPYNDVLIQEFPLSEYTPENVGQWRPLIEEFVNNMLAKYLEHDGFVHVYPQWLPDDVVLHLDDDAFAQMCEECDHFILHAFPPIVEYVFKSGDRKLGNDYRMDTVPTDSVGGDAV